MPLDPGRHPRGDDRANTGRASGRTHSESDMELSALSGYEDILPAETSGVWKRLAPVVPAGAYLAGGTALATHLHHRVSRDLDFFTDQPLDAERYAQTLTDRFGDFTATTVSSGTVIGMLGRTKVQFLDASTQTNLAAPTLLAGVPVAGIEDLLAMKLKMIMGRGELRDYFDIMRIEQDTELNAATGVRLYLDRYSPDVAEQHVFQIVRSIGYLDDVADDPGLPMTKQKIAKYWARRQPEIARDLRVG